jgi:hypothetical protein
MAMSYIAQALVVTIVGLNMGFRYARHCMCIFYCECIKVNFVCILKHETRQNNRAIWKKMLLPKNYQASTSPQQLVVLPHHEPNSGLAKTKKSLGEGNALPQFLLTFCFATLHTRIVVPDYQNSLVEICHEAEVSSPSFVNRIAA